MADNACSVTVVGSRTRVDVSLPGGLPVSELVWDLVDLVAEPEGEGRVPRWGLVRTGGRVLSGERGLAEQGVTDGSMLFLRDLARPPEPPAIDDYAEAVALAVDARGGRWTAASRERVLLAVAVGWALVASAFALRLDGLALRTVTALCGAALLVLAGTLAARRWGRGGVGATLALSSLPLWGVGGMGAGLLAGLSGLPLYPAAAGFVGLGAVFALFAGETARAPVAGVLSALGAPAAVAALCLALGAGPVQIASVLATLALVGVRFAPRLAVRLAGLGSQRSLSPLALRPHVDAGHSLLAAMVAGAALVMAASCVLLALDGGWYERGLVAAVALGAATQVRHFRFALEAAPLALAALAGLGALELAGLRYLWAGS
ncbi:type VII secretion integral membrane protein EccD, partial [Candidatus Nephthysia bennettiae]|nr:type VII secretion integral membrane protein EccD [Candidatus Dormibacteraeota bacterium]